MQHADIDRSVFLHGQKGHVITLPLQILAVLAVGRVLDRRGDKMLFGRIPLQGAVNGCVIAFRPASGEHNLLGTGVDQGSNLRPGKSKGFLDRPAELMGT